MLLLISFSSITYLTYGWKALSSIETINFTQLLETVFKNQINLLFGVAFLVGIVLAFYALGSIAFAVGRYTINYIRKLIRKLLDWKKKT